MARSTRAPSDLLVTDLMMPASTGVCRGAVDARAPGLQAPLNLRPHGGFVAQEEIAITGPVPPEAVHPGRLAHAVRQALDGRETGPALTLPRSRSPNVHVLDRAE